MNKADGLVVFFDGACGLCSGLVRFLLARDGGACRFAALGSAPALAMLGPVAGQCGDTLVVLAGQDVLTQSEAVLALARVLPAPWSWAAGLGVVPRTWRDAAYRLAARNRHRLWPRRACPLPTPDQRQRFLDHS
jgi:predicted DCC family thiol-disulfide oxidoreductase YuxK